MKNETLEGFLPKLLKKLIIMDLPPSRFFYSRKGKITPPSSKSIKRLSKKFKKYSVLQICYSGNPQYSGKVTCLKVTTHINSDKQFRLKFKFAKVAYCKITL